MQVIARATILLTVFAATAILTSVLVLIGLISIAVQSNATKPFDIGSAMTLICFQAISLLSGVGAIISLRYFINGFYGI